MNSDYKNLSDRMIDISNEVSEKYNELIDCGVKPHRAEEMSRDGRWNDA